MGYECEEEEDDAKDTEDEVWGVAFEKGFFVSYIYMYIFWFLFFPSSLCIRVHLVKMYWGWNEMVV